jgi:transposase-like protein
MDLAELTALTEDQAREYIEKIRWPHGPVCPHCGGTKVGGIAPNKDKKVRAGLYTCLSCMKQFTVTVDTVMHDSHIPLRLWLMGFHLITFSKKGVSALQLQRNLGLGSYKSAWHLAHRIRYAMSEGTLCPPLKGIAEVDETHIGGKPCKGAIRANVHSKSRIMTDEFAAYGKIGTCFKSHEGVKQSEGGYSRGDVTTNTIESYFVLLKRGVHGIFHHVSKDHLHRYLDEFSSRWTPELMTANVP